MVTGPFWALLGTVPGMKHRMSTNFNPTTPSTSGEPTWEVAQLMPRQGEWSEADYFELHTNKMAELVDGRLEVLPMPSWLHQLIVEFLCDALKSFLREKQRGGKVLFAPLPARLFPGTIREPDVLYVAPENLPSDPRGYPEKLDFVVEVVSGGDDARRRDYEQKRIDYARAKIGEYWIVDPEQRCITVLGLSGDEYQSLGCFVEGQLASGHYFKDFQVEVSAIMALEKSNS